MTFEQFAKYLAGKDFDTLLHEAKVDSEDRVLGQGIAYKDLPPLLAYKKPEEFIAELKPKQSEEKVPGAETGG